MNCRFCGNKLASPFATAPLLRRSVSYFDCAFCGYIQTEEPTWLNEAYASPINVSDTGIMSRNLSNVSLVLATLTMMECRKAQVVDYAGGHGFLVRLLRDIGVDALWADPYSENLVARGFEYEGEGQPEMVMAFEVFEHFVNPAEEMEKLMSISPNILFTTTLAPQPTPQPQDWWYYGLDHGQHVGFYRIQTLQYLANKFGLHLLTDGISTHFLSRKRFSYPVWKACRVISRRIPRLFALGLYSKTWSDHLKNSKVLLK